MLFVVCDGLSATAVQRHAVPVLRHVVPRLSGAVAPIVVAEQGRVALGDAIGEAMGAEAVAVLIGERPGLSAADSLGIYLTWQPHRGRTDAERNCISNVRPDGLAARGRGRQAAMADRRDAASSSYRHRAEGRAARRTARSGLTTWDLMPDGVAKSGTGRTNMPSGVMRGFLGFIAGAIAVLIFHQGMVELLHALGACAVRAISHHARAAVRRPGHCQQLLLGRAVGRSVRSPAATLHLADLAVRPAARPDRGGGRMVCRRTAEGHVRSPAAGFRRTCCVRC